MPQNYVFWLAVAFGLLITIVQSAPAQLHRRRHQRSWHGQNQPATLTPNQWKNPCNYDASNSSVPSQTKTKSPNATALQSEMVSFVSRLHNLDRGAIDTSEINQWTDKHKNTYSFLHRINVNNSGHGLKSKLKKWHNETQVYCGAFQWLYSKQMHSDDLKNEGGKNKSEELKDLLDLSRNLLCEIETVIISNGLQPVVMNENEMRTSLRFRNNHHEDMTSQDVDDLDNQFAKARFSEYLQNMQTVLNKKQQTKNMKNKKNTLSKRNRCRKLRNALNKASRRVALAKAKEQSALKDQTFYNNKKRMFEKLQCKVVPKKVREPNQKKHKKIDGTKKLKKQRL